MLVEHLVMTIYLHFFVPVLLPVYKPWSGPTCKTHFASLTFISLEPHALYNTTLAPESALSNLKPT